MLSNIGYVLLVLQPIVLGLQNGLARTPPMGWLAWTRFMCQTDCVKQNKSCISENLFLEMADVLVAEGYATAGYSRVNIDDCWSARQRSASDGRLVADPQRFSHGIKWLADQMHKRNLKLGIYANYGQHTCMGFPGTTQTDFELDAATFAEWDVDMLKFDGCFNDPQTLDIAYPAMGKALNNTGREMVYSCSWPYYIRTEAKRKPNYKAVMASCNLWRNYNDIFITFTSVKSIINFYVHNQDELAAYHGPGHWNDPDMLIIGNPGITIPQARVQMALWCIWSAPLLMSNDLRSMVPGHKEILLNTDLIAVNQDVLGYFGKMILKKDNVQFFGKRIMPYFVDKTGTPVFSYAIALYNTDEVNKAVFSFRLRDVKLQTVHRYATKELFSGEERGSVVDDTPIWFDIQPSSAVMFRFLVLQPADRPDSTQHRSIKTVDPPLVGLNSLQQFLMTPWILVSIFVAGLVVMGLLVVLKRMLFPKALLRITNAIYI